MSSVDSSGYRDTIPTIKKSLRDKLVVNGMVENVHYVITSIRDDSKLLDGTEAPKVGESISIEYCFKPYDSSGFAYEFLSLFVGRPRCNYVKYFNNLQELHDAIDSFGFRLDTEFAWKKIRRMQADIEDLMTTYKL